MTTIVMPFLMSMLLGRTIDLTSYTIGSNIYDDVDYDEIAINKTGARYVVLQENVFPYNYFGLPVDVVLRIKTNFLSSSSGFMGLDGFLKDTSWKYNSVIIAITAVHRSVDRSLKKDAALLSDWQSKIPETQTHYASGLHYGGWTVVLFRIRCDVHSDVQVVRNTLTTAIGSMGELNETIVDTWNKALEAVNSNINIKGQVRTNIYVYSTVQLEGRIESPESLLKAVKNLPNAVGKVGTPLFMTLNSLDALDSRYPVVEEYTGLIRDLEKLDEMFDDVKTTKHNLMKWISETLTAFTDEQENKISKLLKSVNDCIKAFYKVGAEASLFKDMDHSILFSAFKLYLAGKEKGAATYDLAYRRLKEDIDADCSDAFLHKIKGLLKVYTDERVELGEVGGGLEECKSKCLASVRCRSIGYADELEQFDFSLNRYIQKTKQCWIFFRSSSTAAMHTPNGMLGDVGVYDRKCH